MQLADRTIRLKTVEKSFILVHLLHMIQISRRTRAGWAPTLVRLIEPSFQRPTSTEAEC